MWGNSLPEFPITQDEVESAYERAIVKADMRGHKLLQQKIEPRFCCECLKINWFLVALEENGIGYLFSYRYCIGGLHDTMKERIKRQHWTDR